MGRVPSFSADESSHSAACFLNVGNLRDTGHSAEATPPAALAELLPAKHFLQLTHERHRADVRFLIFSCCRNL